MTCVKTQGFLAKKKLVPGETVDARKARLGLADALAMLDNADELISSRGKKVERIDLRRAKPSKAEVERLMLGPTGSLRAPTFRVGRTVVVGFDEAAYKSLLG
jgi:arsenate reductase-like glutaredoxin family protein